MTGAKAMPATVRVDAHLLARDLACASGTLSEIATTWRRVWQDNRELPLGLPVRP